MIVRGESRWSCLLLGHFLVSFDTTLVLEGDGLIDLWIGEIGGIGGLEECVGGLLSVSGADDGATKAPAEAADDEGGVRSAPYARVASAAAVCDHCPLPALARPSGLFNI